MPRHKDSGKGRPWQVWLAYAALYLALHACLESLSAVMRIPGALRSLWQASAGLDIAFLLHCGPRFFPFMAVVTAFSPLVAGSLAHPEPVVFRWAIPLVVYALVAFFLRLRLRWPPAFPDWKHLLYLLAASTAGAASVSWSLAGYVLREAIPPVEFWQRCSRFWVAEMVGIHSVAPATAFYLLPWVAHALQEPGAVRREVGRRIRKRETPGFFVLPILQFALLTGTLLVGLDVNVNDDYPLLFAAFVPLIWIVDSHGRGGAAAAAVIGVLSVVFAVWNSGITVGHLVEVQIFILVYLATAQVYGMVASERRRAKEALVGWNEMMGMADRAKVRYLREDAGLEEVLGELLDAIKLRTGAGHACILEPRGPGHEGSGPRYLAGGMGAGPLPLKAEEVLRSSMVERTRRASLTGLDAALDLEDLGSGWGQGIAYPLLYDPERSAYLCLAGLENGRAPTRESVEPLLEAAGVLLAADSQARQRREAEEALKDSERQLFEARKMESIGSMAGGIAHYYNNLLAGMLGYAQLAENELPAGGRARTYLGEIVASAEKAAALTRQVLAYGRKQVLSPRILDLSRLVTEWEAAARERLGPRLSLRLRLPASPADVLVDSAQLRTAFFNLLDNAREAMAGDGEVVVEVRLESLSTPRGGAMRQIVPPGTYGVLSVRDGGRGMDEATLNSLFEPFFTTKGLGNSSRTTGLGLMTVYGVVKQSGGHIHVESRPGQGCLFEIYLPLAMTESRQSDGGNGKGIKLRAASGG